MKYAFLLIILLASVSSSLRAEITVRVKVDNPTTRDITFRYIEDPLTHNGRKYTLALRPGSDEINTILSIPGDQIVTLEYDQLHIPIYVAANDQLDIRLDGSQPTTSITFAGQHAAARQTLYSYSLNAYLLEKTTKMFDGYCSLSLPQSMVSRIEQASSPRGFFEQLQAEKDVLNRVKNSGASLPRVAQEYMDQHSRFAPAAWGIAYILHWTGPISRDDAQQMLEQHRSTLQISDLSGYESIAFDQYARARLRLEDYINPLSVDEPVSYFDHVDKIFSGQVAEYVKARIFFDAKQGGDKKLVNYRFEEYSRTTTNTKYKDFVIKHFNLSPDEVPDAPVPNFRLPNESGRMVTLDQYRGKVVYISFWATWCKPCLEGFKKNKYVRDQLLEKGVVLINISIDDSPELWRKTMGRFPMQGINLQAANADRVKVQEDYGLSSLPVYIIVDKQGRYAYLPETKSRNIVKAFEILMRQ